MEKLLKGLRMRGKGPDRHEVNTVETPEGKVVAVYEKAARNIDKASAFIQGHDLSYARTAALSADFTISSAIEGQGMFSGNITTVRHPNGAVLWRAGSEDEAAAFLAGWTYGLKRQKKISRSGNSLLTT